MKGLKIGLRTLSVLSLICFVVLCGVRIVKSTVMHKPVAHVFNLATVTIKEGAGSMSPTLNPGDTILIKKQKGGYSVGDVVVYTDSIGLVTHRIVEVTEEGYRTKGDNLNNSVDPVVVTEEKKQGKMISNNALSGFSSFMLSVWGNLSVLVLIIGIDLAVTNLVGKKENACSN